MPSAMSGSDPGMPGLPARYLDRPRDRSVPVVLTGDGARLVIRRPDGTEIDRWRWDQVGRLPTGDGEAPLYGLAADAHAVLVITDEPAFLALAEGRTAAGGHRPPRNVHLLVWAGGALVSVLVLLFFIFPLLANVLAPMVPDRLQRRVGTQVADVVSRIIADKGGVLSCQQPAGKAALDKLAARLPHDEVPPFRLRIVQADLPNAFAVPGQIVMTDGILRRSPTPEAALGVLAHELGHIVHGDSMRRVIRYTLASTLVSLVVGDAGGGIMAVGATQLSEAGFSQQEESEADAYASDLLLRHGYPPAAMADLFRALVAEYDIEEGALTNLFGSHPRMDQRIAILEQQKPARPADPVLTPAEWDALQRICQKPVPAAEAPEAGAAKAEGQTPE